MTESKQSDVYLSEEVQSLLASVHNLQLEKEQLNKLIRETQHNLNMTISQLKLENDTLKKSNTSMEELIKVYKQTSNAPEVEENLEEVIKNGKNEEAILELEKSHQNLTRQIQFLQQENRDLKIKFEYYQVTETTNKKNNSFELDADLFDLDNLDCESKEILKEIIKEYGVLRNENMTLRENSLNLITEKENENYKLQEELERLKIQMKEEITKLQNDLATNKSNRKAIPNVIPFLKKPTVNDDDYDNISLDSQEEQELIEKYAELSQENEKLLKDIEDKDREIRELKLEYNQSKEELEHEYMQIINESKLKIDQLTQEIDQLGEDRNLFEKSDINSNELEKYQMRLELLEDHKVKNEAHLNKIIAQLNTENDLLTKQNKTLNDDLHELDKNFRDKKNIDEQTIKQLNELLATNLQTREKESQKFKIDFDILLKEKEHFKGENEGLKKKLEISRNDYNSLQKELKLVGTKFNQEKKRLEELLENEKKKIAPKKSLYFTENLANILEDDEFDDNCIQNDQEFQMNTKVNSNNEKKRMSNSQLILSSLTIELQEVKKENETLKKKIVDLSDELDNNTINSKDLDYLKKENLKAKNDIIEIKQLYEDQINELQGKLTKMTHEINKQKKKSVIHSRGGSINPMMFEIQTNIGKYQAENEYLNSQIEILKDQINQQNLLNAQNVEFLKNELHIAEQIAVNAKVNLASLAFEKDQQIISCKLTIKKLRGGKNKK